MDVNPVPLHDSSASGESDTGADPARNPVEDLRAETAPDPTPSEPEIDPAPAAMPEPVAEASPDAGVAEAAPIEPPPVDVAPGIDAADAVDIAADDVDVEPGAEEFEGVEDDEEAEEDLAADSESAVPPRLRRGEIVEGIVKVTSPTEILIQIEDDLEGIISSRELARMDQQSLEELEVGGAILVYVLNPSNRNGQAVLSLSRALEERDWRRALEYHGSQDVFEAKVSGYNRGGLIVRFGRVRGFVPASQVSDDRRARARGDSPIERWGSMIGEDIKVKVIEVDRDRNRLILSERAAMKEVRDQRKADLLEKLEVGAIRKGRVVSLTDFGAFVDLGGADGLIHLTELSWKHVTRPEQILEIGQEVEVEVISLDRRRNRIGLSMKSLERDPWSRVMDDYRVGQLVRGRITKLTKFGAFACLVDLPEVEGLIHISELAENRVAHPRDIVREGEIRTLRVIRIDRQQRRLGLSIKQVNAIDYLEIDLATYGANSGAAPVIDAIEAGQDEPLAVEPEAAEVEAMSAPVEPEAVEAAPEVPVPDEPDAVEAVPEVPAPIEPDEPEEPNAPEASAADSTDGDLPEEP
ncbi:MAG: S1 RNA-binding domain-containing protein [Anaerolineae bacterium]|nr:S1 RNA-binding domain-containing protein [Anaerolineae bacterium]